MLPRPIIKHLHLCYLQCLLSSKLAPTDLQQEPITSNGLMPVVNLVSFKIFEIHHSFYAPADHFDSWRTHLSACLSSRVSVLFSSLCSSAVSFRMDGFPPPSRPASFVFFFSNLGYHLTPIGDSGPVRRVLQMSYNLI